MIPEIRPLLEALQRIVEDEKACNCVSAHSWYGEGHASECPISIAKSVSQTVEAEFSPDGECHILDGPFGDYEWDDASFAVCRDCGYAGELSTMKEKT